MALSLQLSGILWWNFAYTLILTWCSPWDSQMTFGIGRGFAEVQILKTVKFNSQTVWNILIKFCRHIDIDKIYLKELQNDIYHRSSLCWVEYFDKLLRKHWYWQDLDQEIAKWHFSLVEALPSSKFWKSDKSAISWTEWDIVMKCCIHIDIDKMYPMRLSNDTWDRLSFCRGSNSEKVRLLQNDIYHRSKLCQSQILKKWKWPYLLNWVEYFDRLRSKHWYY